jgi:hypothetical protein
LNIVDVIVPIFLWPPLYIIIVVAGACSMGGILAWLTVHVVLRPGQDWAPQPTVYSAVIGLFSLLLSFNAYDTWRRNEVAISSLFKETQEIAAMPPLLSALESSGHGGAAEARQHLADYVKLSLDEEWAAHNTAGSAAAGAALDRIRAVAAAGLTAGGQATTAWRVLQDRLDGLQQGRTARLVAGGLYGNLLRWGALLALYLAGAVTIAMAHLERPKASGVTLAAYMFVSAVALSLVALSEHPYIGWDDVEPHMLVEVLQRLGR